MKTADKLAVVIQEILQDKIYLDLENNLRTRAVPDEAQEEAVPYAGTGSIDE
jgi:hypothetical protein